MIFRSADSVDKRCPVQGQYCAGTLCACWRWAEAQPLRGTEFSYGNPFRADEPERPACVTASWEWIPGDEAKGIGAKWLEPEDAWKKRCRVRRGYCGLGGKPEFGYADTE